jgi:chaperone required for assembly of F1-ATPase
VRQHKRFYRAVSVIAAAPGFAVALDGRVARTPAGAELRLASAALADALAREWDGQGQTIEFAAMPLNRLAATAIDRVGRQRVQLVDSISAYAGSDLLCYRAEHPAELVARQNAAWAPLLDWARDRFGAVLVATSGVIPVAQPQASLAVLRQAVDALDNLALTGLASAVQITGSLVIGLALAYGRLTAEDAFAAAMLDERYQAERWGSDAEAESRRRQLADELSAAASFMALAGWCGDRH